MNLYTKNHSTELRFLLEKLADGEISSDERALCWLA